MIDPDPHHNLIEESLYNLGSGINFKRLTIIIINTNKKATWVEQKKHQLNPHTSELMNPRLPRTERRLFVIFSIRSIQLPKTGMLLMMVGNQVVVVFDIKAD